MFNKIIVICTNNTNNNGNYIILLTIVLVIVICTGTNDYTFFILKICKLAGIPLISILCARLVPWLECCAIRIHFTILLHLAQLEMCLRSLLFRPIEMESIPTCYPQGTFHSHPMSTDILTNHFPIGSKKDVQRALSIRKMID